MYESFLEIAFEAELNTSEDPELMELAPRQCNEYPGTRNKAIQELRKMILDRGECRPYRLDDAYLLRYLRARRFIVPMAHRLAVRNCKFREQYPELYQGVDLWGLAKVNDAYEGVLHDHPDYGRVSVCRFGVWDPNSFPIEDLVRAGLAVHDIGIRQPKMQILACTLIVDLEGITYRHVASITPTVAHQMVNLMGLAVPGRVKSCHIINYSWIINTFFYLFKQFIPRSAWDTVFFHGHDLKSLHEHINPECLPLRYGGKCRSTVSFGKWLLKVKQYRDEQFDKEMKALGYVIKE